MMNDKFQDMESCPINLNERAKRSTSPDTNEYLMKKHNETVKEMALLMGRDPANFSALDAALYDDSIWARYFE